jgi:prepilin-type N-terminal cleavage/methylation domain-containing protein
MVMEGLTVRSPRKHAGFTLVELLVVISIIVLLIALLLPALGRARDRAVVLRCLAQQHQVGTATVAYALDHRGIVWAFPGHQPQIWVGDPLWTSPTNPWSSAPYNPWGIAIGQRGWASMGMMIPGDYLGGNSLVSHSILMCPGYSAQMWTSWFTYDAPAYPHWPKGYQGNPTQYWGANNMDGLSTYMPRESSWRFQNGPPESSPVGDHHFAQWERLERRNDIAVLACMFRRSHIPHAGEGVNALYIDGSAAFYKDRAAGVGTVLTFNGLYPGYQYIPPHPAAGWDDWGYLALFTDFLDH